MRVLLATPSASGLLNHSLALSHLLRANGWEVAWLVGPEAEKHLTFMNSPFRTDYCESHSVNFDRTDPNRLPHLHQVCQRDYLRRAVADELRIADEFRPDLLITKNNWSIPITSRRLRIPWVTYYTGGIVNLLEETNPLNGVASPALTEHVNGVAAEFGVAPFDRPVPGCIESPYLNIARGTRKLSFGSPAELAKVAWGKVAFAGNLNYDGARRDDADQAAAPKRPLIYVTFGSLCYDIDLYRIVLEALRFVPMDVLVTSLHVGADQLGPLPENVRLERYVPNELALQHAHLVIHHGGYGTLLEAVAQGVPQVVIPENVRSTCQPYQAALMAQLGTGIHLDRQGLVPEVVRDAVQRIQQGSYLRVAEALRDELVTDTPLLQQQLCAQLRALIRQA